MLSRALTLCDDHFPNATFNGNVRALLLQKRKPDGGTSIVTAKIRRGVEKCNSSVFPYERGGRWNVGEKRARPVLIS